MPLLACRRVARLSARLSAGLSAVLLALVPVVVTAESDGRPIDATVVGGEIISSADAPYQVALLQAHLDAADDNGFFDQFCGGSIIDDTWVLTAAHCLFDDATPLRAADVEISAGIADLTAISSADRVSVARVITHPEYNSVTFENDIALVELATTLPIGTPTVDVIAPLDGAANASSPVAGDPVRVSGWGCTEALGPFDDCSGSGYATSLRSVELNVVAGPGSDECGTVFGVEPVSMLCAGAPGLVAGSDSCVGDSGGPLVTATATPVLVGVVSWGEGCAQAGSPGVYTRVGSYADWIALYVDGPDDDGSDDSPVGVTAGFNSVSGRRVLDTRSLGSGRVGAVAGFGEPLRVDVGALDEVPGDAVAAAVNVTVTNAGEWGFVAVYPCSSTVLGEYPGNSTVNFDVGATVANSAIVPLVSGQFCVVAYGVTDVIVDVSGFFMDGFNAIDGVRPLDSRAPGVAIQGAAGGFGRPYRLDVGALDEVPRDAVAAAVNITVTNAGEWGFVAAYPCSSTALGEYPGNSTANFDVGATVANSAIVPLDAGFMCLLNFGVSDVIVDVVGFFSYGVDTIDGARPLDTRAEGVVTPGRVAGFGTPLRLNMADVDGVGSDAVAVAVNITVTNAGEWGFVAAYPCSSTALGEYPGNSTVNFDVGATVANSAIVPLNAGYMCVLNFGVSDVIVDVVGVVPAPSDSAL